MIKKLAVLIGFLFLSSCSDSFVEPVIYSSGASFKIAKSCGEVIFKNKIGVDYDSALKSVKEKNIREYSEWCPDSPCYEIMLEVFEIEVLDENGNSPKEDFFAVRVLNKENGVLLHSVSEVVTSSGNLFWYNWCED